MRSNVEDARFEQQDPAIDCALEDDGLPMEAVDGQVTRISHEEVVGRILATRSKMVVVSVGARQMSRGAHVIVAGSRHRV
jgi:hypothetical protein